MDFFNEALGGGEKAAYTSACLTAYMAAFAVIASLLGSIQLMRADTFDDETPSSTGPTAHGKLVSQYTLMMFIFLPVALILLMIFGIEAGSYGVETPGSSRGPLVRFARGLWPATILFFQVALFGMVLLTVIFSCISHAKYIATYQVEQVAFNNSTFDWQTYGDAVYGIMIAVSVLAGLIFLPMVAKFYQAKTRAQLNWFGRLDERINDLQQQSSDLLRRARGYSPLAQKEE